MDERVEASGLGLTLAAPDQLKTGLMLMQAEFLAMDEAAAAAAMTVDNPGGALVGSTVPLAAGTATSQPFHSVLRADAAADLSSRAPERIGHTSLHEPDTATLRSIDALRLQTDGRELSAPWAVAAEQSAMQGGSDRQTAGAEVDQGSGIFSVISDLPIGSAEQTAPVTPLVSEMPVAAASVPYNEVENRAFQFALSDGGSDDKTVALGSTSEVADVSLIAAVKSVVKGVRLSRELASARVDVPDSAMGPRASPIMGSVLAQTMFRAGKDNGEDGEAGAENGFQKDGGFAPSGGREKDESGGGAVTLDGRLLGEWLTERMARQALRPGAGTTFFDVRQGPAWTPSGAW